MYVGLGCNMGNMDIKEIFKLSWTKIIITFILPLTFWYGTVYDFDYTVTESVGKPNVVYEAWKVYPVPLILYVPFAILDRFSVSQRVVGDNPLLNDALTIVVTVIVNYLLVCLILYVYGKFRK